MIDKKITSESDLYNSHCELSRLISNKEEAFTVRNEIRILMNELKDTYSEILSNYQKNFDGETKISYFVNQALKFSTYYDLEHYSSLGSMIRRNECFREFNTLVKRQPNRTVIAFKKYRNILESKFIDIKDVANIVKQTKIFTPYWLLTDF